MCAIHVFHYNEFGIHLVFLRIVDGWNTDVVEDGKILFGLDEIADFVAEITLIDDVVDVVEERFEDTGDRVRWKEVAEIAVEEEDGIAAGLEAFVDVGALELDDHGFLEIIQESSFEDEGDHSAVDDATVDMDVIVALYSVKTVVVDFGFFVAGVCCVAVEFGTKLGI